jgi:hypothetical protein
MNKRTAQRFAGATALSLPALAGVYGVAHAAPALVTPRANSTVGGRNVTFFAQFRALRPVASAKVFLDGKLLTKQNYTPAGVNGLINFSWDSTGVSSGKYNVTLRLYDAGGSLVSEERIPLRVENGAGTDTVAPQVAIITPSPNEEMRGSVDVKIIATDNSGQSPYVSLFVDNQLRGVSNHQPYSYAIDTTEYDNGEHVVEAWAYDAAHNKGTASPVSVRFNNPGGATTLNADVNRMGRAAAPAAPQAATEAPLPFVPPAPAAGTEPATAPAVATVHIPPVREMTAPLEAPAMPEDGISAPADDAPVQTLAVEPRTDGIQEMPAEQPSTGIHEMDVSPDSTGITELPAVADPRATRATAEHAARNAAPVRVARRPAQERKPDLDAAAASALEAAAAAAQTARRAEALVPDAVSEPIVLRMDGETVLPNPPSQTPAPKVRMARADISTPPAGAEGVRPASVSARLAAATPLPAVSNHAPRPAHLKDALQPTAKAVHVPKAAHVAAAAPAHRSTAISASPRPAVIRELPADRVDGGAIHHAVRPGESVASIARAYGVPVKRLLAANSLGRRSAPRIGVVLEVPTPVRIALNDAPIPFDVAPQIRDGMTLAAFRQVYEQAGGRVSWDASRREVRATGGGANVIVHIGSAEALVNGRRVRLDAPAFIEDGRTFLPVGFMVAAMHLRAEYDLRSGSISLYAVKAADRRVITG